MELGEKPQWEGISCLQASVLASLSYLAFSTPAPTGWPPSLLFAHYSPCCLEEDTLAPLAKAGHSHPKPS